MLVLLIQTLYGQTQREIYSVITGSGGTNNYYCVRNSSGKVNVKFKWKGTRANVDNKFIAELSDPNGDFSSPVKLGEITERGNQSDIFEIPFFLPASTDGKQYKIRIRSTSPEVIGESDPFEAHHLGDATPLQLNNFQGVEICPDSEGRTISVTGGTTASLYKWYKDGNLIEGATGNSYTVTQIGTYSVEPDFGRCAGSMRSNEIQVTLPGSANSMGIKIKGNATRDICTGQTITLESEITNEQPGFTFTYQWYKDNTPIAGATSATYQATAAGSYKVRSVPGSNCPMTSAEVKLNTRATTDLLTIEGGETQVKCTGQTITLTSKLKDTSLTGTYKWYKNGTEISGASANTYGATDIGSYYVTLTEAGGCVIKSNVVNVTNRSGVDAGNIKWLGHTNGEVVFAFPYRRPIIELDIPSTEVLTVRWFKEGDPGNILQENTTRSFQVPSEGTFVAEVYDACHTKVSTGVLKLQIKEPSRYIPTIGFKQGTSPCGSGQAILELSSLEAVIVNGSEQKKTLVPSTDYDKYTLQWKKDGAAVGTGKELATTRSGSLSVYRLMVNGAFNSNEVKLVDIKLPTAVRITTNTGVAELQDKRALDLIPTLTGSFQQELFTYTWNYRKDDSQPWTLKKDVTNQTDKKYTIPATPYKDPAFRAAVGQYQFVVKLKTGQVSIGGDTIDLTPYAESCGNTEGVISITYSVSYDGNEIPNTLLLSGEDINRKWMLPAEWAGAKVTIYKQTGEIVYQSNQYNNDFPNFTLPASQKGAAIYYFYIIEKDGKTENGTITLLQ
jgi:putative conserved repeat domain protein